MKFRYFLLADAANAGPDGKVNMLGAGIQIVNLRTLPALQPVAIVGSIEGTIDEAGTHPLEITIEGPEGKVEVAKGDLPFADNAVALGADPELPIAANFQIALPLLFKAEGLRRLKVRYGRIRATWAFRVRLIDDQSPNSEAE